MKPTILLVLTATAAAAGFVPARADPRAPAQVEAESQLTALISGRIREGGSFFTAAERAVIEGKCGYAPGSWDGIESNMSNGAFHCTNGRRVDDPEMRAIMAAAAPGIEARVRSVMASAEVKAALERVTAEATAEAMRRLAERDSRRGR